MARALRRTSSLVLVTSLLLALPFSRAAAQPAPPPLVEVDATGVFGNDALIGDGYSTISIVLANTTASTLRGHVEVAVRQWQQPEQVHEVPLDLPAGETRRALVTVFVTDSADISIRYVDGSVLGSAHLSPAYGNGAEALVVLAEAPRIRAALLDLQTTIVVSSGYAGRAPQASGVPIGLVSFDARTGDPILPDTAIGWARVGVVVASSAALARVPEREMRALREWVHAGGRLLVFPRTDADLALPILRDHFGTLERGATRVRIDSLEPPIQSLVCPTGTVEETFGCSARAGFGIVAVASFDGTAPPYVDLPSTRGIVEALVNATNAGNDPVSTSLPFAEHTDDATDGNTYYGSAQVSSFGQLRAALDPNEAYRPALALIAVVLFLYVILVGPLNFWWVQRRKTPTYALVTTPIIAFSCVVVMFVVGYVGKGVLMRYRRLELVEVVDGDAIGVGRRYTGLYATRPTSIDVPSAEHGGIVRTMGGSGGTIRAGDEHALLRDVRAGLWETVFTREDRIVDLGGGISFVTDGRRLASVVNGSPLALHGAFVIDGAGQVYVVGEVPAGGTAPIALNAAYYIAPGSRFYDDTAGEVATLRDALGLTTDDDDYVVGVAHLLGTELVTNYLPVLYAQTEPDAAPASSPSFAAERDLRIVRVVPRFAQRALYLTTGAITELDATPAPTPALPSPMGAALDSLFGGGAQHGAVVPGGVP